MKDYRLLDLLRRGRTEMENHLIDGFVDGRVSRRDFLRHGSVLGLSMPLLGGIGAAAGYGSFATPAAAQTPGNATVRVGCVVPTGALDPVSLPDVGGLIVLQQVGDFLVFDGPDLMLKPMLAESWSPDQTGTVWTFKLRQGVKFHNGQEMKADDVVATFERLCDPAHKSNALSVFDTVLSKGGTRKVDDYTVAFHLDAPNGNFPYLVSTDNYNSIILPAGYSGNFETDFNGTGPFRMERYTPKVGATLVRNEDYWGAKALPARLEITFFPDIQPQVLALQAGQLDVIGQIPVLSSVGLANDPSVTVHSIKASTHYQIHMRTDLDPFKDPRVRRAIALSIDREKLVKGLLRGAGTVGNDSPFASVFPSGNSSVPQRKRDVDQAKQLLSAAGIKPGTKIPLAAQQFQVIPEYAQLMQNFVKDIGLQMELSIMDSSAYYGDAVFGNSTWLDSAMGITDYGHRGVPNVFLNAPLRSGGSWNAAHYSNPEYDRLVDSYAAALDIEAQRDVAGKIETLLLEDTPVIFGFFYDFMIATRANVQGVVPTAIGQLFLNNVTIG